MKQKSFHKNFQLNGLSFQDEEKLLNYSKTISAVIYNFLEDWFSNKTTVLVNTSGSTGTPKPIQLQKKYMINSAVATGKYFNLSPKTSALLCLPVNFIAGKMMLVRALTLGLHLDVLEVTANPLKDNMKSYDFSAMVPLQVENSIKQLHKIKKLIIGGGVVSHNLYQKLREISTEVFATYGMTETITHIAVKKINNYQYQPNFYEVLPDVNIFVDERNCLVIEANNISDTPIVTNDVVQLVTKKSFEWLGRFDNVINSGGIKLQPEKIEAKLQPYFKQRFFISAIKDDLLGEKVVLVVEGSKNDIPTNAFLQLSNYEKPKKIFFTEKFIETKTNKVNRKKTISLILKI